MVSKRSLPMERRTRAHRILLFLLLAPLLAAAWAPRVAQAQLTRVPLVAVVDFEYPQEPAGAILARQATDAVVVEMTRLGRFDVVPRAQVMQQMREMGLSLPLSSIAQQKLGQALGVDYVASGMIVDLSFQTNRLQGRAELAVQLTDVASGELANGALAAGTATLPTTGSAYEAAQAMVTQALQNAAFRAVGTMNSYRLPEATVLITRDNTTVRLNQGIRGGIQAGQEFVILRGGQRVGRVRVTTVTSHEATAVITDPGRGIRPEDRARAVFALRGFRLDSR